MGLNWFLPVARGKRRGEVRRWLGMVGPTWLASPVRRVIQAGCFVVFLGLFFYVSWPYTARPVRAWPGWLPVEVDGETGRVTVQSEGPTEIPAREKAILHATDTSASERPYLGVFRVAKVGVEELQLEPASRFDAAALERLAASFGPWSLSEREPGAWPSHYAEDLNRKETLPAESFLVLDPLVSISTAVAARAWVWSLAAAGAILAVSLFVPRGFCGYVCPLGSMIDLFDWSVGKRVELLGVNSRGWWVQLKYYVLAATLAASLCGVLVSGYVAAIPVVTRGMAFLLAPVQTGLERGWHQVPPIGAGEIVSIGLFAIVVGLGVLRPRFWCRYVCPTGAVFSLGNLFRLDERKVEASCIACDRCVEICPFDAIHPDFTTRTADCTFCQTCGGVCPTGSIKFVSRWNRVDLKPTGDAEGSDSGGGGSAIGRRGFLGRAVGMAAASAGGACAAFATRTLGGRAGPEGAGPIVRPPGSVPEREFLAMCIRCGACFQACPNDVLQPLGFERGSDGLWTPVVTADWSGCEPSCNNCGQVCPTGAIRALPLEEKRVARMGLAVINQSTCLPYAEREACQLCVDECATAGYDAIEFIRTGTEMDPFGEPVEGSGFLAPVVLPEKCVGCGLCQSRCRAINCREKGLLEHSAVWVEAGPEREDRLMRGSYRALRKEDQRKRQEAQRSLMEEAGAGEGYLPSFLD